MVRKQIDIKDHIDTQLICVIICNKTINMLKLIIIIKIIIPILK